jgi:hypothetical protein
MRRYPGYNYGKPPHSQGKTEFVAASKTNQVFYRTVHGHLHPVCHFVFLAVGPVKYFPSVNLTRDEEALNFQLSTNLNRSLSRRGERKKILFPLRSLCSLRLML